MKILNIQDGAEPPHPTTGSLADPKELGRLEMLEKIASSILQKLQSVEDRVTVLETTQKLPEIPAAPLPAPTLTPITLDSEAVKKNLLNKMWKYLNDQAAA